MLREDELRRGRWGQTKYRREVIGSKKKVGGGKQEGQTCFGCKDSAAEGQNLNTVEYVLTVYGYNVLINSNKSKRGLPHPGTVYVPYSGALGCYCKLYLLGEECVLFWATTNNYFHY